MTTYPSMAAAAADPESNLSRALAKARETMAENRRSICALMAQGKTREEAWALLLAQMA